MDQKIIKHMLDQKLSPPSQQVWVSKLLGFDFKIHYKEDSSNTTFDALSKKHWAKLLELSLSNVETHLMQRIYDHWHQDPYLKKTITKL